MSEHAEHSHPSIKEYMFIFFWLAALTVIEVIIAYMSFLPQSLIIFLLVSLGFVKAILVALYYMHLKVETAVIYIFAAAPVVLTPIMLVATTLDVGAAQFSRMEYKVSQQPGHGGDHHGGGAHGGGDAHSSDEEYEDDESDYEEEYEEEEDMEEEEESADEEVDSSEDSAPAVIGGFTKSSKSPDYSSRAPDAPYINADKSFYK
jgi:cytochrome c oxidase subunit 4